MMMKGEQMETIQIGRYQITIERAGWSYWYTVCESDGYHVADGNASSVAHAKQVIAEMLGIQF
jgi:hypothetical protein